MNSFSEYKIESKNGANLNICEGINIDDPKGIILILHGIGSHHQFVMDNEDCFIFKTMLFSNYNFKSYGLEFSGHGKSDGLKCSINNYEDLVEEIRTTVLHLCGKHPAKKIFIYSESMGAGLSIMYQIKYGTESYIESYVLMSPMCGVTDKIKPNFIIKEILFHLSYVVPTLPFLAAINHISESCRNKDYLEAKLKCEYQYNDSLRLNTARECYKVCEYIEKNGNLFDAPLYLFHGIDDTITDPKMSINFYKSVKNEKKQIYLTKDSNHILTLGIDKNDDRPLDILKKVINFFDSF